ncbi:MAG: hypothetical protein HOH58_18605 [Opitutaceae bacterium]|jgi:hypothetical protein|nr:hypothetical protein [Opitutaceae bacterium]
MERSDFKSYAYTELSAKEIREYAIQYDGVDMAKLMGANENRFPFLIQDNEEAHLIVWWIKDGGIKMLHDEDRVRSFATAMYLKENAYPVFKDIKEAENWAKKHDWPLHQ